ncbi:glycoside hydrolase family 99-like domain-containing protein [Chloroflexota bacterium]
MDDSQKTLKADQTRGRLIAFYLPQFHPIPENDRWWGPGFTEWTNVAKARPLFRGHYQPHIPADLGFYDLRLPETRASQAEMAREHGIEGFCYWHYWFAGKRLLERPFAEVLRSGEPDLPFCLAWANQSWTGVWHGAPDRVLIEQTYPGRLDHEAHFNALLEAFWDPRYLTMDGRPIFLVNNPNGLPNPGQFTDCWRELAIRSNLDGLYFIGIAGPHWNPLANGFDAATVRNPGVAISHLSRMPKPLRYADRISKRLTGKTVKRLLPRPDWTRPAVYQYADVVGHALPPLPKDFVQFPCVIPNWDNTPRSASRGVVFADSSPELFGEHLEQAIQQVSHRNPGKRLVFVKSWNEWAEGNYLEPDQNHGRAYLQMTKAVMSRPPRR